jgi:hypothetical protein
VEGILTFESGTETMYSQQGCFGWQDLRLYAICRIVMVMVWCIPSTVGYSNVDK